MDTMDFKDEVQQFAKHKDKKETKYNLSNLDHIYSYSENIAQTAGGYKHGK